MRSVEDRIADVRRVLAAARSVYRRRSTLAPEIARSTGLSIEGVIDGFECLERDANDEDLRALVAAAGDAARVHVILSANVFVAPLRAIVLARAASDFVTVRPSPRDPVLARALVEAVNDPALSLVDERGVESIEAGDIHVYGRDETIARVREAARAKGVRVRGHGAGMGVAWITRDADLPAAASALARDVVAFDQRGCLSPRAAIVEGDAELFAIAADAALGVRGIGVPRGALADDERSAARAWIDAHAFSGRTWVASDHAVALAPRGTPLVVPPPGRHLLVAPAHTIDDARSLLAPLARLVVALGSNDPARAREIAPAHARTSALGVMQRPPLDGPVDRR